MPDLQPSLPPVLSGRYRIQREIGHGGNAVVYLAHDEKHDRLVALKVLVPELAESVRKERFLREIQIAAKLSHPHILPLHDSGEADGKLYYVMPYVQGESLRARLAREQQLPIAEALRIAREVASALDYAHGEGVVHRDIKPENILLQHGVAMAADFGIARALSEAGSESGITHVGIVVGTPDYMSPEQAAGKKDIDGRSDVYALGCVLYEMLAGHPPFTGGSAHEVLARHALDPVPRLAAARADVPDAVEAAVRKALAKTPGDRFATTAEFAGALGTAHSISGDAAQLSPRFVPSSTEMQTSKLTPNSGRIRRPAGWRAAAVTLLMVMALGAAATVRGWTGRARSGGEIRSLAVLPFVNVSDDSRETEYFSDGLTEELITALMQVKGLQVASRTSSYVYKDKPADVRQIARELDVSGIIEASVRRDSDSIRIIIQLTDGNTGKSVWGTSLTRDLSEVLRVQDEVAYEIVAALQLQLGALGERQLTSVRSRDLRAYDSYLKGRYEWNRRTRESFALAIKHFEDAIGRDSTFAVAYSGLADTYVLSGVFGYAHQAEVFPKAEAIALKALHFDPNAAEAHASLGRAYWEHRQNPEAAEAEFRRALDLNPRYAIAHSWYGRLLATTGRPKQGIVHGLLAVQLDPISAATNHNMGLLYSSIGDCPKAIPYARRAVAISGDWIEPLASLYGCYLSMDAYGDAAQVLRRISELRTGIPGWASNSQRAQVAYLFGRAGQRREAMAILDSLKQGWEKREVHANAVANAYLGLGDKEMALRFLEQGLAEGRLSHTGGINPTNPNWDSVRQNPRFQRILRDQPK